MPQAKQFKCACGADPFNGTHGLSTHQRLKHKDRNLHFEINAEAEDTKPSLPSPDELRMMLKAQLNGTNDFDTLVQLYTILKDATEHCKERLADALGSYYPSSDD